MDIFIFHTVRVAQLVAASEVEEAIHEFKLY